MGFLNSPLLWGGLAAAGVAVPIIIHLLYRKHKRKTDWAAMELLRRAMVVRSGQIKLEDFIILALRCLAILFVAAALLRPTHNSKGVFGDQRVGVVIAIDASYSMTHGKLSSTRFKTAVDKTNQILETLKPGDPVTIVLLGDKPRILMRTTSYDEESFKKKLEEEARAYPERLNLGQCLVELEELVTELKAPVKECYILTDAQEKDWQALADIEKQSMTNISNGGSLYIVPISGQGEENLAITNLSYVSGSLRRSEKARFNIEIQNQGRSPSNASATVTIIRGDEKIENIQIGEIPAGETKSIDFLAGFESGGLWKVKAELSNDNLVTDNQRFIVVEVRKSINILTVDGDPKPDAKSETFFLNKALLGNKGKDKPIIVSKLEEHELISEDLSAYDIIFLANVADVQESIDKLRLFVNRGGGLFIFGGDLVNDEVYNKSFGDMLPLTLQGVSSAPQGEHGWSITGIEGQHPISRISRVLKPKMMNSARFNRMLKSTVAPGGSVILSASKDNLPLLAEKKFGAGKVFFFTSSANLEWCTFAYHPLYLMIIDQIVTNVTSDPRSLQYFVGQPAFVKATELADGTTLKMKDPNGISTEVVVTAQENKPAVCTFTSAVPGIYEIDGTGIDGQSAVAVNVDPAESNVKNVDTQSLITTSNQVGAEVIEGDNIMAFVKDSRVGIELSKYLLYLGILFFLVQSFLAMWFSKRLSKKESENITGQLLQSSVAAARRS